MSAASCRTLASRVATELLPPPPTDDPTLPSSPRNILLVADATDEADSGCTGCTGFGRAM